MADTDASSELSITFALEGRGSFSATGRAAIVLDALDRFRADVAVNSAPTGQRTVRHADPDPIDSAVEPQKPAPETEDLLPLAPFVKAKAPKTNPEAVAVMAVWAKKKNNTTEFTAASLGELWRLSGRKASGNLNRDVIEAARSGWLHRTGQGKYTTTTFGELFVDGLPATPKAKDVK
jgi:hypothetical protein